MNAMLMCCNPDQFLSGNCAVCDADAWPARPHPVPVDLFVCEESPILYILFKTRCHYISKN